MSVRPWVGDAVDGVELTCRAKLRRLVRELVDDLLDLGYTPRQLERRSVVELDDMRHRALCQLMAAPRGGRGDGVPVAPPPDEAAGPANPRPGPARTRGVRLG